MENLKSLIDSLLIVTIEELMLQTGLEKHEILIFLKDSGYICNQNIVLEKPSNN